MVWGSLASQILFLPLFLPPFSWLFGFSSSFTLSSSASFIFSFTFRWSFWGVWSTGGWVWSFWVRTHFLLLLQSLETDILNLQCVHVVCIHTEGLQLYICNSTYFSRSSACKPFTVRSAKGQLHEFYCIQHKALSIRSHIFPIRMVVKKNPFVCYQVQKVYQASLKSQSTLKVCTGGL